ncbi:hypothetical protein Tco_1289638, partial [Tanacetum coccineum]
MHVQKTLLMHWILKKRMNLLKTALYCQYGLLILQHSLMYYKQMIRDKVQKRKNKSLWMNLKDLRGKKRRLIRKLKLSGRSLHKKLRTWLYNKELLSLAVLTSLVLLAHQLKLAVLTFLVNTVSIPVSTASPNEGLSLSDPTNPKQDDSEIPPLEDIYQYS